MATCGDEGGDPITCNCPECEWEPPQDAVVKPLYADQTTQVGCVYVWNESGQVYAAYGTTGGWLINKVYLHVDEVEDGDYTPGAVCPIPDADDIPQNKANNPKVGHFDFERDYLDEYGEYYDECLSCTGPLTDLTDPTDPKWVFDEGDEVYVAAHANVERGWWLPPVGQVTYRVTTSGRTESYFISTLKGYDFTGDITVTEEGTQFPGWCIDAVTVIQTNRDYLGVRFYPSYGRCAPEPLREYPSGDTEPWQEKLNCINFVLNNKAGSYTFPIGDPNYPGETVSWSFPSNWEEIQGVIWWITNPTTVQPTPEGTKNFGGITWNNKIVWAIYQYALENNCEEFEPGCGDIAAVIVDSDTYDENGNPITPAQLTIIEVPVPCDIGEGETAWGACDEPLTCPFLGNNWATYFTYELPTSNP